MIRELAELWKYRELVLNLVIRDIRVRYKNSVLGFFWSLANPLLQVATITIVFKFIMNVKIPNYSAYLLCAFLPWTFFQMSLLDSSMSVLMHGDLVKKTYFPREALPVSIVLSNLVHFILALGLFFIYLLVLGTPILLTWLLLPVVVLIQLILTLGISLFISCLNVFYEDIKYMMTVLLTVAFYGTPIIFLVEQIYYSDKIPAAYQGLVLKFFYLNPLSMLMIAYRKLLLPPFNVGEIRDLGMNYTYLGLAAVTSLLIFIAGYTFFNRKKWLFAELL
ncbi:MAG: ABC transporter permease [Armatimonadetes bacterium]|nr:ABC transporter permease [Armatimonadota bacterium]